MRLLFELPIQGLRSYLQQELIRYEFQFRQNYQRPKWDFWSALFQYFLEILGIVVLYNRNAMLYAQSIYTVLSLNFAIYFIIYAI